MSVDVIVVGSGPAGVHAAYPLVEAGFSVLMLDVGNEDNTYESLIPQKSFLEVRAQDPAQHRYFLGDTFEGIPIGGIGAGPQLTPPRQFIVKDTERLVPTDTNGFFAMNSLALGGMACGWGAGAYQYTAEDLKHFPIGYDELRLHYERVAERIGVSGERDDLLPFKGDLASMLPPLDIDRSAQTILARYQQKKHALNTAGLYIGKPRLAALSQAHRGRGPDSYRDMSFWSDADESVWRPKYTLRELLRHSNFRYQRQVLVHSFQEQEKGGVIIHAKHLDTGEETQYQTKKLILAASTMGSARIVLRSLRQYEVRVPLLCNSYTYYPMLNLNMVGQQASERMHSLAQLSVVYQPPDGGDTLHGRIHAYRSLLSFKVIKMMPLPYREALRVMQAILSNLVILALDQADYPAPQKYCILHEQTNAPDRLEVAYQMSEEVRSQHLAMEKRVVRLLRSLGCWTLKRVWPGYGISLHYGGTFPMTREDRPLTVDINHLLRGTQSVYLADGAVFPYIPAKGMTLSIMAMADRAGEQVCKALRASPLG